MVSSESIDVGDEVVALNAADRGRGMRMTIKNAGIPVIAVADLGPEWVSLGSGFELAAGASVYVELEPNEVLYAVSTAAGTTLKVLRS